MWFDTYATMGGADQVLPVDYHIPGCPPRPEAILHGVAVALGVAPKKVCGKNEKQALFPDPPEGESTRGPRDEAGLLTPSSRCGALGCGHEPTEVRPVTVKVLVSPSIP